MKPTHGMLLLLTVPLWGRAVDETQAPPARFELQLGEQTLEILAGEPFELEFEGQTLRGELTALARRTLRLDTLSFDYLGNASFEYERWFGVQIWTLDGNDTTVMVQRFAEATELSSLADSMQESLQEAFGETERAQAVLELGGRDQVGVQLVSASADIYIFSELFAVDERHILVLQDVRDLPEQASEEFELVRAMLSETLELH